MQPLAYSYQRFSSPEQAKGDSLRRQDEALQRFLTARGLTLDTTLRFVDAGISGFKGKHRADDTTALGHFLSLVRAGRIPKGSYLIVESVDRLSRENVTVALELLLGLLRAGIRVVQLSPSEVIYDAAADPLQLVIAIVELGRGNSESRMKSVRISAAWAAKKKAAREKKLAISGCCPKWLRRVGDGYEPIPDRVETIRRIFELSADGYGIGMIIPQLVKEGRKPWDRAKMWGRSYIGSILSGRAVLGEYQPKKSNNEPDGDPIPDFYPAVIDETLYYRAQAGLRERKLLRGRVSPMKINLFAGLLYSALDGSSMIFNGTHGTAYPRFVNSLSAAQQGERMSFPAIQFETAVLKSLTEIDPQVVTGPLPTPTPDCTSDILTLSEKLIEVETKLRRIEDRIVNGDDLDLLVEAAKRLQQQRAELSEQLTTAKIKAHSPDSERWGQCRGLIEALEAASDPVEARLRLRSAMRRVVKRIDMIAVRNGVREVALVQFRFIDSAYTRTVIVYYRGVLQRDRNKTEKPTYLSQATAVDGLDVDLVKFSKRLLPALEKMVLEESWCQFVEPSLARTRDHILRRCRNYEREKAQRKKKRGKR